MKHFYYIINIILKWSNGTWSFGLFWEDEILSSALGNAWFDGRRGRRDDFTLLLLDDWGRTDCRRLLFRRCRDNVLIRPPLGILIRHKPPSPLFRSTTGSSLSTPRLWSIPWCEVSMSTPYSAIDCRVPSHILLLFVQLWQYGFVSSHLILLFRHV